MLENFLDDKFLPFLDIFQGDTIQVPDVSKVLLRIKYIKIYNDSRIYELDYLSKKYKKKPSVIREIIDTVHRELKRQGGDYIGEEDEDG